MVVVAVVVFVVINICSTNYYSSYIHRVKPMVDTRYIVVVVVVYNI